MNDTITLPPSPNPKAKPKDAIDFGQVNENLLEANRQCVERTRPLLTMLGRCKQQFTLYAESHRAKGTEEGNQKAETNEGLARDIDEVLSDFRKRETAESNEVGGQASGS